MTVFIDVHSKDTKDIEQTIDNLQPFSGICLFIDITNSTKIKYNKGFSEWVLLLKNTFGVLSLQNKIKNNIVKFIGDAIMIFVPDETLFTQNGSINNFYTLLEEVFATVDILKLLHIDDVFMKCKVAIHYCEDVYNITFFKGYDDYYGKDIDITARLLSKAKENTIVISDVFYQKVINDLSETGKPIDTGCLTNISGKYIEDFKGVPFPLQFRRLTTPHGPE